MEKSSLRSFHEGLSTNDCAVSRCMNIGFIWCRMLISEKAPDTFTPANAQAAGTSLDFHNIYCFWSSMRVSVEGLGSSEGCAKSLKSFK